ncbi:alpha/beta hydrolase [Gordonia hydrophobica]|uniref:Lipase n=1 Tax=Gordonia hydrophobica TaxID=40516 RepID=A0ABZ2U224_9ACTN|nr:hypothetical protein [Gordonia hydrophobica]MBM7369412.1 pimeloyl-ACP methyl ester carboxylesterase [Gordonia hydrophobica]
MLLIPGTSQTGAEAWNWNYVPALSKAGFHVCTVDLRDRGLADIQTSTEYVVNAVRTMVERYRSDVSIIGFSQGPLEARWAVTYWPDVRENVDDLIAIEAPNRGAALSSATCSVGQCVPSMWQMRQGSTFLTALSSGDQTPGDISYTSIYSQTDEFVFPQTPLSVSRLSGNAKNIRVQSVCPGRVVDHVGATGDAVVYALAEDALIHAGAAQPARVNRRVCGDSTLPGLSAQKAAANYTATMAGAGPDFAGLTYQRVDSEPALRCYAKSDRPRACS